MRFVPMRSGLSPLEDMLRTRRDRWTMPEGNNWEFGRLALDPAWRAGPELLQRCVFLAVSHLVENFDCRNAYASCNHVLSRLYRHFGFSVVLDDVAVPGAERAYHLIHARAADVLRNAARTDAERTTAGLLAGRLG
jgi:predicted GNAT family N-acyltransferase